MPIEHEVIDLTGAEDTQDDEINRSWRHSTDKKLNPDKPNRKGRRAEMRRLDVAVRTLEGSSEHCSTELVDLRNTATSSRSKSPSTQHEEQVSVDMTVLDQLFFVDIKPTPAELSALPSLDVPAISGSSKLLLPDHVSVFGVDPVEIIRPTTPEPDEENFIEYLEYEERKVSNTCLYTL